MKRPYMDKAWTDPSFVTDPNFCYMSYALYREYPTPGTILCARCPCRQTFGVGRSLSEVLDLSEDALAYLRSNIFHRPPMFVWTQLGLGILLRRYSADAGLGIYLHVHCEPKSAARLLKNGAIPGEYWMDERIRASKGPVRRTDSPTYAVLAEAWSWVQHLSYALLPVPADYHLHVDDLRVAIERLAAFVGCQLTVDMGELARANIRRVACYYPLFLEALLLYFMAEARDLSARRDVVFHLGYNRLDCDHLRVSVEYKLLPALLAVPEARAELNRTRELLRRLCDLTVLRLEFTPLEDLRRVHSGEGISLLRQTVLLEGIGHPTLAYGSTLRAFLRFLYEDGTDRPELPYVHRYSSNEYFKD